MLQPNITRVCAMDDYKLMLSYDNGETRIFDMKPFLHLPFYKPLADIALFKSVHTVDDGWTVEWANGVDFPPEDLYEKSIPAHLYDESVPA